MRITFQNDVRIIAEHNCMTFMFSIDALMGERAIPKTANTTYNIGRKVVGMYIDHHYRALEVLWGDGYHVQITEITKIKPPCTHYYTSYDEKTSVTSCTRCGATKPSGSDWIPPSSTIEISKEKYALLLQKEKTLAKLLRPESDDAHNKED